ncbi:MAG: phospholipase D-like domain-containing protein [Prevotellaceae bacterium]|jgi:superfamily II DNA/RNA helicase|nr:phospholipase D-like domain-containing protein [Prevotellaceae bacterium]
MSSKFFTNKGENTLFDKFRGIAQGMANFHTFHAVAGFFRSSGYFKLREELKNVEKIQILVGINIDNIFRRHNRAMLMFSNEEEAKKIYTRDFVHDLQTARYSQEVEHGIMQLCEDLHTGKMEMKIHATKNLHAKFYLCLPEHHSPHSDGWVIMGSSNISESGLGLTEPPRYELNVAMKDFDDVDFCKKEFDELWKEAIPITASDVEKATQQTHVKVHPTLHPTPYELYIKVLIDSFGDQVEDDFSITLPDGVRKLEYQKDAAIQGYQMLCEHNGFFLADVVGLGKTIVATMIATYFIESNGKNTNILVVSPPALENSWKEAFKQFGISRKAQFVSNGSLSKIIDGQDSYKDKEDFDLVIVDEAHGFRSDSANRYDELQRICKSRRRNAGLIKGEQKKVMLLSATPLNNRPNDLLNLLLLFQDAKRCTIVGINNLHAFFAPLIERYNQIMKNRNRLTDTTEIDAIYEEIRSKALDKITVRRTRHNIWNNNAYRKDLEEQNIKFPDISPPKDLTYQLSLPLNKLFYDTLKILTESLNYARYRAVEFLSDEHSHKFKNPVNIGENLAGIYRVHMVKRLESSFFAFKRSLDTFLTITEGMIKMFREGAVIIAPELNVKKMQIEGWELDRMLEEAAKKGLNSSNIVYSPADFVPKNEKELLPLLESDRKMLLTLKSQWEAITEDPKLDLFINKLQDELFDKEKNPTGKLVVFSESVDTVSYLEKNLKERLNRKDILKISSANRTKETETICRCFDANYETQSNEYNIVITSDVLAEGVNLHRASVIVNYDSPWNATRLMQRIGRVNRIGSLAGKIYNYMFYPSAEGDKQIQLYKNALIKLQGFHSALGEDAQIYSKEEIVKEFQLFKPNAGDKVDKLLKLLEEVRALYHSDRDLYKKIKALPMKSRTTRAANGGVSPQTTIAFISSPRKTEYYKVGNDEIKPIDFLEAAAILKASKEEQPAAFDAVATIHFEQVNQALEKFRAESIRQQDADSLNEKVKDRGTAEAQSFFRSYTLVTEDDDIKHRCNALRTYIQEGIYTQLAKTIRTLSRKYQNNKQMMRGKQHEIDAQINDLYDKYYTAADYESTIDNTEPSIVLSETFI